MGREIRRVPEGWRHPKRGNGSYKPMIDEDFSKAATWYQVYETVSEGTPVSPPFATEHELIDYLVENGDFWCQQNNDPPPGRESATRFVKSGYAPSMVFTDGAILSGIDAA